jgi:hypothetical protein
MRTFRALCKRRHFFLCLQILTGVAILTILFKTLKLQTYSHYSPERSSCLFYVGVATTGGEWWCTHPSSSFIYFIESCMSDVHSFHCLYIPHYNLFHVTCSFLNAFIMNSTFLSLLCSLLGLTISYSRQSMWDLLWVEFGLIFSKHIRLIIIQPIFKHYGADFCDDDNLWIRQTFLLFLSDLSVYFQVKNSPPPATFLSQIKPHHVIIFSRVWVPVGGVWIGNRIYWTLRECNYK